MINQIGILLTKKCNLKCDYCYVEKDEQTLSFDVFCKAIRYFISQFPPQTQLNIAPSIFFLGGEPLISWSLLRKCVEHIRTTSPFLRITLTTNALLLDSNKFKFLKQNKVELTLSIDGPHSIHDNHRRVKGTNKGSLSKILKNLNQISLKDKERIAVNTVIAPGDCYNLIERFLFIRKLGFVKIRFYPAFQPSLWKKEEIANFSKAMHEFGKQYSELFLARKINEIFVIESLRDVLKSKIVKKDGFRCLEGKLEDCNSIWLDTKGDFYICERILGIASHKKKKYKIGDVKKGIDFSLRDTLLSEAGKHFRKALLKMKIREEDSFFCPFSFYFRQESFYFYFEILRIYKSLFSKILKTLSNNFLFNKIYNISALYESRRV